MNVSLITEGSDMRKNTLPKDIQKLTAKKNRSFTIKCLIWLGLVLLTEAGFLYRSVAARFGHVGAITSAVILAVLPVAVLAIIKAMSDRAWEGKVILVECSPGIGQVPWLLTSLGGRVHGGAEHGWTMKWRMSTPVACKIYVETNNGKTHTYAFLIDPNDEPLFEKGDHVKKFKDLPYPLNLSSKKHICAVCGNINPADIVECSYCNHTIVVDN